MKLHLKGWLLVRLLQHGAAWDAELAAAARAEYGPATRLGGICLALEELASGGLVQRLSERLLEIPAAAAPRLSFRYVLTPFGAQRMHDTGLLPIQEQVR